MLAIEGGDFAEGRVTEALEEVYELGVRVIQPAHRRINEFSNIQTAGERYDGLPGSGKRFIREMNRLGIIVDIAHLHLGSIEEVMSVSTTPVLLSHTFGVSQALLDSGRVTKRAVNPRAIRQIAEKDGVIGIWNVATRRVKDVQGYAGRFAIVRRHAGSARHVALGTDLGGPPAAMKSYRELPELIAVLVDRHGFSVENVEGILGDNFLLLLELAVAGRSA